MGGDYGSKIIYLHEGLSRSDLYDIGLATINARPSTIERDIQRQPTIAIDCNNIIHAMRRSKADPVAAVANFLDERAQHDFVLVPVVDGAHIIEQQQS